MSTSGQACFRSQTKSERTVHRYVRMGGVSRQFGTASQQAVFALDHARKNRRAIVTTNYVIAELVALLTSPMRVPRREQTKIVGTLRSAGWISILHVDPAQDEAAWDLLTQHDDKTWSFVDCTSFVYARTFNLGRSDD